MEKKDIEKRKHTEGGEGEIVVKENRKKEAGEEIIERRQRCQEEQRERETMREGGIGFDTNKSVQQSRKVEMRKGGETDLMKRNQALNTEGGPESVARSLCVSVYCREGGS